MRASIFVLAFAIVGCDKSSSSSSGASSGATASPSASATASASASASTTPSASATTPPGPTNQLTPERRAKVEAAIPEAKDFVDAKQLGHDLDAGLDFNKAFADALGKSAGKWVLFRGTMNAMQKDTFGIAVTMLEVDPNSPFGAPKFLMFNAKDIKGYDASKYQPGDDGAVLAKVVAGKPLAIGPGYDLVALGYW